MSPFNRETILEFAQCVILIVADVNALWASRARIVALSTIACIPSALAMPHVTTSETAMSVSILLITPHEI